MEQGTGAMNRPELDIHEEFRDVSRVIALQVASFGEMRHGMFLNRKEIRNVFTRISDASTAIHVFRQFCSPTPHLTRIIWEKKDADSKSPDMYILPGGGGLDIPNPTPDEIIRGGLKELKDETGHTTSNARLREDCTRTYGFDMRNGNVITKRRNRESLIVAYIPRRQSTKRRFVRNENIVITQRFTIEQVSHLLHDEVHVSSAYPGTLIDNLSLKPERHALSGVIVDLEDTHRTRNAIETEMWVYEARMWKRLALALLRRQSPNIRSKFRKQEHTLRVTEDPTDSISATMLMATIRTLIPKIERVYPKMNWQSIQTIGKKQYQILLNAGIPMEMIHKRLALMRDMELAYKDAFHTTQHKRSKKKR